MRHSTLAAPALTALTLLLAACGGGGGDSSPTTPPPPQNNAPSASLTADVTTGTAPLAVAFDGSGSSDSDGQIANYSWDFGDGNSTTTTTATTSHSYANAGNFTARLTVTDDDGATGAATLAISVDPSATNLTLSGRIQILTSSAVDSDVNDILSVENVSNNSFATAQPLPVPVTLGGYLNQPGTGPSIGRMFATGDTSDVYALSFAGGETIALNIGDAGANFDLRLFDDAQVMIDGSSGSGRSESVEVPDVAGDYFVEVINVSGASTYVLTVGSSLVASAERAPTRLTDPFVPGEILMRETTGARANASGAALSRTLADMDMTGRAGNLVRYRMRAAARRAANADLRFATPELAARHATLQRINAIRAIDPDAQAEPNLIRRAHLAPNDPLLVTQWHYDSIRLPLAWDVTTGSSDVIVAVVDTGVLTGHPDFAGQLVPGFDFVSDPSGSLDGDGIDADPNDPGDGALFGSSSFHGTHVAGTVAARTDNGVGVAGSGWNTRIMPLRALAGSTGSNFDILQAIRFAAGLSNDSGTVPAEPADVINLSLGSEFSSPAEAAVLAEVRALGIIVVASAGNESTSQPSFPAAYDGVVSVSATTIDNNLATYSNFGNTIDIAAPGGDNGTDLNGDGNGDGVLSAIGDDSSGSVSFGYGLLNGTSMAAPHVAGVVALMKAVHPALTPDEFDTALIAGDLTEDLGVPGRDDQFGFGLLSAQRAVFTASELASGNPSNPGPFLTGSASRLNFGSFQEELALTVENAGGGSVSVTAVTPSEPWLAAIADSVDGDGLGAYRLTVDRMGLADGTYTGSIRFDSTANAYTVNALMQVSSIDLSANAGTHFVILVSEAGDTVAQTFVNTPVDGFYDFTLTGIDAGNYRLFAGTDLDNDDFLCDAGEACGAFRTIDAPEEFSVSDNRSDLDFTGGFRQTIGAQSRAAADGSAAIPAAGFAIDKLRAKAVESQAGAESRP